MDLISVIVPVYNVEKYLDACVESIVNQTYENLEIILVDDGSPDRCPEMCDTWARKDSRIKVIHKENGGQGEARNYGIKIANGDYIGFVDSDDKISLRMYERLLEIIKEKESDVVQCAMQKFSDSKQTVFDEGTSQIELTELCPKEAVELLLRTDRITSTCPNTLLTKSLCKKILFDTEMINEDVMWIYRVIKTAEKTVLTNEVLYFYYQREDSTMNSAYSEKRFDALNANMTKMNEVKKDFPDLYPYAAKNYTGSCFYHYQMLCRLSKNDEYVSFKKRIYKRFCESDLETVLMVTNLKYKLWYWLFKHFPDFTCKVRNLLKIGL